MTPEPYLAAARHLGFALAKRGHICVNGAGSYGCMAAMNDGASVGEGHIVGVIHEMWLVDSTGWNETLRDGGAHRVFTEQKKDSNKKGPLKQLLVASGKDLTERKRLLVEGASALICLPGGPGTFDELFEYACARNIGISQMPIVCINVNGYYNALLQLLERAYQDQLTKLKPLEIIHFVDTAEEAVRWVELVQDQQQEPLVQPRARPSALRESSFLSNSWWSLASLRASLVQATSWMSIEEEGASSDNAIFNRSAAALAVFVVGLGTGFLLAEMRESNTSRR